MYSPSENPNAVFPKVSSAPTHPKKLDELPNAFVQMVGFVDGCYFEAT